MGVSLYNKAKGIIIRTVRIHTKVEKNRPIKQESPDTDTKKAFQISGD